HPGDRPPGGDHLGPPRRSRARARPDRLELGRLEGDDIPARGLPELRHVVVLSRRWTVGPFWASPVSWRPGRVKPTGGPLRGGPTTPCFTKPCRRYCAGAFPS